VTASDLDGFRRGDPDVFRRVVEELSPRLLSLLRCYALDPEDALDLLQQTWTRAFEQRLSFSGRGSLTGWIMAVGRNLALDAVRARRGRPKAAATQATAQHADWIPAGRDPADREMERVELGRALNDALLDLPERQRDVVVLRLIEGLSVRDTAHRMDCAEGTVKATLHHALTSLKQTLKEWRE